MDIALAQILWVKSGDKFDIIWRDRKDEKRNIISQTEFIVHDKQNPTDEDFLYKVIVYPTTGSKVFIQGKEWQHFCDNYFEPSLKFTENLENQEQTLIKECTPVNVDNKIEPETIETRENSEIKNNSEPDLHLSTHDLDTVPKEVPNIKPTDNETTKHTKSEHTIPECVEETLKRLLQPLVNRMNVMEEALVDIKETSATLISNQQQDKTEVVKEIDKWKRSVNQSSGNTSTSELFEKQIKEKDSEIKKLSKKIDDMSSAYDAQCRKLQSDFNLKEDKIVKKLEEAHKQQDEVVRDNEKLVLILQQNDEKLDNLKQDYESKLKEKDKQSSDLQDRIQSYLYDLNGEPWGKIISKHEEQEVQMGKNQFNPTNNRINTSSLKDRQHKDTPEQSDHRRKDQEKRKGSDYDILFLHDSICHEIDMRRLIAGSNRKGVKVITYTIEDASAVVSEMNFAQTILLHVGINNLKSQPAEEVFSQFSDLVNLAHTKSGNVVISLPTPSRTEYLNNRVQDFNTLIKSNFERLENITLSLNGNFSVKCEIIDQLFFNHTKLSREHGIRLLAGNLRRSLFPGMKFRQNQQDRFQVHMPYGRQNIHSDYPIHNMKGRSSHVPNSYTFDYNHKSAHNWNEPSDSRLQVFETDKLACSIASAIKEALRF